MNVHVYTEPGMASVNSYIVEGAESVFVIDAQRSTSSGAKLLGRIQQIGKPVAGIFLTHPHPDHFGGLPVLTKAYPQAPLYALAKTYDSMASGANGYIGQSKQALGDDFDTSVSLPTQIIQAGDNLTVAGIALQIEDAGPGEAECMMMLYAAEEKTLFCADVVQHGMTAFLLEGHLDAWLTQLTAVAAHYGIARVVYPGHGASGTAANLFQCQRAYLQTFKQLISEQQITSGKIAPEGKKRVVEAMNQAYPGYLPVAMIPELLALDVDAVAGAQQETA